MTKRVRLVGVIASFAILLSVLIGTGAYVIVNHINKLNSNATTTFSSIGNMLKTKDVIDNDTYQKLLTALGNDTSSTRKKSAINGGTPVVFQMGEVNGNKIYWQVVYQAGDIITVWMTDPYTAEYYNRSGSSINNSTLLGYTTGQYTNYSNYSQSVLRDVTAGIYTEMTTSFPVIANIVKSPSAAGATWQKTQTEDIYAYRNSSSGTGNDKKNSYYFYAHHNGLDSYSGMYTGWSNDLWNTSDTPYNDEFWIPSYYEVYNTTDHATSTIGYISSQDSFWGLTDADRGFSSSYTSTPLNGIGSVNSYCWLRSGSL